MKLTEEQLRMIIREQIKNPATVLEEGILSSIMDMFKGGGDVKPAASESEGAANLKDAIYSFIGAMVNNKEWAEQFDGDKKKVQKNAVRRAKSTIKDIFEKEIEKQ